MNTANKPKGYTYKFRIGVIPGLTLEEAAKLRNLIETGTQPSVREKILYIGQGQSIKGTLEDLAAFVIAENQRSQPGYGIPKGWEALLFKRDPETGMINVSLLDRKEPHFTLSPVAKMPSFLIGMFAVLFKKLGLTQDTLNVMFSKVNATEAPAETVEVAEAYAEPGKNGSGEAEVVTVDEVDPLTAEVTNGHTVVETAAAVPAKDGKVKGKK